ncbi:GAF domain-containing protein [Marinobacterium arenosum]|uniref:GAF domain-containing protein n=1 Tax=Marinobacterium arenosum TaxID=2862496 RepID=UPI001C947703|nr:hypothetical protein [Marinobacterium arenosum]MBY4675405.1 hypothetical protein [Marinobacterium arenosum]
MRASHYLALAGLELDQPERADQQAEALNALRGEVPAERDALYRFQVPELGEGGACSLFGQLAEEPYDLRPILGGESAANDQLLADLNAAAEQLTGQTGVDWLGLYARRTNPQGEEVLVKLAYRGAPSRAEFPLNPEFATISNNSTVGLSGKGRLIQSVADYLAQGGEYYTCDPKVQAELCIPLFDKQDRVIGILDAEAFTANFFDPSRLAALVGLALWTQQRLSNPSTSTDTAD